MALTFSSLTYEVTGSKWKVSGLAALTSGGGTVTAAALGLDRVNEFRAQPSSGYIYQYVPSSGLLSAMFGDYNNANDAVFIADATAAPSNVPFEAVGS